MNRVKVLKCHKKLELNPLREQTLNFINSNLPVSCDKHMLSNYKKNLKQYLHSILLQCTDKENIEYVPTSDFEKSNETQNEEFDKFLAEENENLTSKLKLLQQKFELKKQNLVEEEIRNFENKARDSKIKNEKNDSENLISFIDSKKEMKTYNKVKLFKSFSQHHEEKLQGHEDSVKDALEDLERTIKNFNEDFKIILDKQKDLLIMTNNDAINNVMLDFKQLFK